MRRGWRESQRGLIQRVSLLLRSTPSIPTLDIDAPLLGAEVEGLERTLLTKTLCLIDELVASVVSLARISFRVLVYGTGELRLVGHDMTHILCITLPSASRTACEVKFSEGMRLIKCFWRFFSCKSTVVSFNCALELVA
jgi:hypothetical protein